MVDLLHPDAGARDTRSTPTRSFGTFDASRTADLRELAYDLVGRPELDELSPDEQLRLTAEIDSVIARMRAERRIAGRPATPSGSRLAELLSPRIEALPLHLRVTLANARRRQLLGID